MQQQLNFLIEIDKVKNILRQSLVMGERRENDAEHSWHMALCALTFQEYYNGPSLKMDKVLKMILIHDIIEIYAGDVPAFSDFSQKEKEEKEYESAIKIYSFLPDDQREEFMNLWLEFEEMSSNESKFAVALDRFQGFMQNLTSDGFTWVKFKVRKSKVLDRMEPIKLFLPKVYEEIVLKTIEEHIMKGSIIED